MRLGCSGVVWHDAWQGYRQSPGLDWARHYNLDFLIIHLSLKLCISNPSNLTREKYDHGIKVCGGSTVSHLVLYNVEIHKSIPKIQEAKNHALFVGCENVIWFLTHYISKKIQKAKTFIKRSMVSVIKKQLFLQCLENRVVRCEW